MSLPAGYSARPVRVDDLESLVAVANAFDVWDFGRPDAEPEHFSDDLAMPGMDLERDTWFVADPHGVWVGFGIVTGPQPEHSQDLYALVHPDHHGRGIGGELIDLMEARARERVPAGASGALTRASATSTDSSAAALLGSKGYFPARYFWHMERDLGNVPEPDPPPGITVRRYRQDIDDRVLYEVMEESFSGHWGFEPTPFEIWVRYKELPSEDPDMISLTFERDRAVGFVIEKATSGVGWVEMLGVLEAWRGRGIGSFLLRFAFADLSRRGFASARLNVDAANETGATRLYERAGMRVRREWLIFERPLS